MLEKSCSSALASPTNPCPIAYFYEKRKRQSPIASTKPQAIASIRCLIWTAYCLIMHNKLYDYASTQKLISYLRRIIVTPRFKKCYFIMPFYNSISVKCKIANSE